MSGWLMVLAVVTPLALAGLLTGPRGRRWVWLAALPSLAVALWAPTGSVVDAQWLLLGSHFVLDEIGRLFLLFGALVWLVASVYMSSGNASALPDGRHRPFFLLAMAGNVLLILAADMISFYAGFALMGLAAYGVLLRRSQTARHAARVYLVFTLVGELALFAGVVILFGAVGSSRFADLVGQPLPAAAVALLLIGFGVKVALPGLHPWLPMAYTAGPVVTVAVLSGPMMKAGLLGWLRFLPPGDVELASWGPVLVWLGALGVVLGAAIGVLQRSPRAVLAYSSIAKMGLISALFGTALANPHLADALVGALVLFAMHHMLVKSALFLGIGEWLRAGAHRGILAGLLLLVLSLAALPWTGGAAAKLALGAALQGQLGWLVMLSAVASVLLMVRFLILLPRRRRVHRHAIEVPSTLAWLGLVGVALWAPFRPTAMGFDPGSLWPPAAGLVLGALGWRLARARGWSLPRVPPGDLLPLGVRLACRWRRRLPAWRLPPGRPASSIRWPVALPRPAGPTFVGAGLRWLAVFLALLIASLVTV